MRILVTNDDGINAPALGGLAFRLARDGHDVVVAAPADGQSGCGASIGQVVEGQLVALARVSLSGAEGIPAYSVSAPPAFIVLAAVQGMFGASPEVVVSGPNSGLNLGPLVLHSGTLSAAITAAANGVPGIALSTEKRARDGFATASDFCARNLDALIREMGANIALNINVPDLPMDAVTGVRRTKLAPRSLVAIVLKDDASLAPGANDERRMCVSLEYDVDGLMHRRWRNDAGKPDNTDAGAIIDGFISLTAIHGGYRERDDFGISNAFFLSR